MYLGRGNSKDDAVGENQCKLGMVIDVNEEEGTEEKRNFEKQMMIMNGLLEKE